ncbi:5199_t:CDS:2, partial [Racocetra persica]
SIEMSNLAVTDYENFANNKMPNLGYEIEDFQHYTWQITGWGNLDERVRSPGFIAGGCRWRILLYPFGNNNYTDYVSMYLESEPHGASYHWHSCAQFTFTLWNSEDPTLYVYNTTQHRFNAEGLNLGYPKFCEQRDLFVPMKNQIRPLIENDSCNITVFVRVIKDPTGYLWHNFKNYDSKRETGCIVLKNEGTTGYMNASLQLLFNMTSFRKAVYQIPTDSDKPDESVQFALQNIFYQMQTSNTPVRATELMKSFGWDSLNSFMQHDAHEFNKALQNNLESKMKDTNAISALFAEKIKSHIKCIDVDYESYCVEDYYDIQLNVKGCKNLDESFMDYIKEEILEGNNKYNADGYGLQ